VTREFCTNNAGTQQAKDEKSEKLRCGDDKSDQGWDALQIWHRREAAHRLKSCRKEAAQSLSCYTLKHGEKRRSSPNPEMSKVKEDGRR